MPPERSRTRAQVAAERARAASPLRTEPVPSLASLSALQLTPLVPAEIGVGAVRTIIRELGPWLQGGGMQFQPPVPPLTRAAAEERFRNNADVMRLRHFAIDLMSYLHWWLRVRTRSYRPP